MGRALSKRPRSLKGWMQRLPCTCPPLVLSDFHPQASPRAQGKERYEKGRATGLHLGHLARPWRVKGKGASWDTVGPFECQQCIFLCSCMSTSQVPDREGGRW